MNLGNLAGQIIGLGAPLLGQALGGPLGAAAGQILANAVGAPSSEPAVIADTVGRADPTRLPAMIGNAEDTWAAALAEAAKVQVAEVAATQRAEMTSGDALQRWWRPIYALELSLIECPAFALTLLHALWAGHDTGIAGFATLSGLLMTYFGARFGVLGVYVAGRTREKQATATGEAAPTLIGEAIKAIAKRR